MSNVNCANTLLNSNASATGSCAVLMDEAMAGGLFAGAVVAVGDAEGVKWCAARGLAQVRPTGVPMRRDSVFDLASLTKVVATGTACALLLDRGQLDLDATLMSVLPEYRGDERLRLRHLATHCSGFDNDKRARLKGDLPWLETVLRMRPRGEPGARCEYACIHAILLGLVVEAMTGERLDAFCQREIFEPLGMRETGYAPQFADERMVATHSPVLRCTANQDVIAAGRALGNAGVFSTVDDLAKFCQCWLKQGMLPGSTQRLFSQDTFRVCTQPLWSGAGKGDGGRAKQASNSKHPLLRPSPASVAAATSATLSQGEREFSAARYGLLWHLDAGSPHRPASMSAQALGHGGYTGTSLWIDPVSQRFVIVLTNRTHRVDGAGIDRHKAEQDRARGRLAEAALQMIG